VGVEVVAKLRRDHDLVAHVAEGFGEHRLALAVAVGVGGVEEGDAQVVRPAQQIDPLPVVFGAPPARADRPEAEADGG